MQEPTRKTGAILLIGKGYWTLVSVKANSAQMDLKKDNNAISYSRANLPESCVQAGLFIALNRLFTEKEYVAPQKNIPTQKVQEYRYRDGCNSGCAVLLKKPSRVFHGYRVHKKGRIGIALLVGVWAILVALATKIF